MVVSFFGHSSLSPQEEIIIEEKLLKVLEKELANVDEIKFHLGGYGCFNKIALKCCKKYANKFKNAKIYYITPYISNEHRERYAWWFEETDYSIYPELERVPLKFCITKRNEWMINKADLIIIYVTRPASNSAKIFEKIKRSKKRFINLGNYNG